MSTTTVIIAATIFTCLHSLEAAAPTSSGCTYHGATFDVNTWWVDADECNVCGCNEYGVNCLSRLDGCNLDKTAVTPLETVCRYHMTTYLQGQRFKLLDGCNTCLCGARGMECTYHACAGGFEQPSIEPLYGDCHYNNVWYRFQTQWLATDRCNTCYCYAVGNYQGGYECSTSACPWDPSIDGVG